MLNITITAEKRDGGDQFSKFDIGNYSKRTFGMFAGDENTLEIEFDNTLSVLLWIGSARILF